MSFAGNVDEWAERSRPAARRPGAARGLGLLPGQVVEVGSDDGADLANKAGVRELFRGMSP
jgi:hypothetical protein